MRIDEQISESVAVLTLHGDITPDGAESLLPARVRAALDQVGLLGRERSVPVELSTGEQQRVGFQTYIPQRMSGFAGVSKRRRGREFEEFPELLAYMMRRFPNPTKNQQGAPEAQAEIHRHNLLALMFQNPASLDELALALHTANVHRDRMPRRRLITCR